MKRLLPTRLADARVLVPLAVGVWLLIFAVIVWPQLRRDGDNARQIADRDAELRTLAGWQQGRSGLAGGVADWEAELSADYERRFPRERGLKELFFDIAAVANRSGVDPIHIRPQPTWEEARANQGDDWDDIDDTVEIMDLEGLCQELGIAMDGLPGCELTAHRLSVDFEANYENLTRFIAGLATLQRAVNVASVQLRPGDRGSVAQIDLEYYVQAGN